MIKLAYTLIYVDDVKKTMSFYHNAFGLTLGFVHESLHYGEMETGDTKLGFVLHETAESHGFTYDKLDLKKKPSGFEIAFTTPNVKAAYQRAIEAGATPLSEPEMKPWGQEVSYVRDCNGMVVELCSEMAS